MSIKIFLARIDADPDPQNQISGVHKVPYQDFPLRWGKISSCDEGKGI